LKRILPVILLLLAAVFIAVRIFPRITMKELTVVTIPQGAFVYFNGVESGISPLTRFIPGEGVYLMAEKEGFFPRDTLVESTPDTVFLQLSQGCVVIVNTIPTSCSVQSGVFSGVSPCSIVVRPGNPIDVTVTGTMGLSVTRTVNVLSSDIKLVNITVPYLFTDTVSELDFAVLPADLLPFGVGPITVARNETTVAQFTDFMNSVDSLLVTEPYGVQGRTVLLDSIMKSSWHGPVGFNFDTTSYASFPGMEDHPITGVTRRGAELYCIWLTENSSSGLTFRLPDPYDWSSLAVPGKDLPPNLSDSSEVILSRHPGLNDGWAQTAPSGAMGYSEWGLGNMQGNVWEWTSEPGTAVGGSWLSSVSDCTADAVISLDEDMGYPFVGFRVVASGVPRNIIRSDLDEMAEEL